MTKRQKKNPFVEKVRKRNTPVSEWNIKDFNMVRELQEFGEVDRLAR